MVLRRRNKLFGLLKKKVPDTFINVMKNADLLAEAGNIEGLKDLIKLILRPIQSNHLLHAYISEKNRALKELNWSDDFGVVSFIDVRVGEKIIRDRTFASWCWSAECLIKEKNIFPQLDLSTDIVLPTPWHPNRILSNIGSIGEDRPRGQFKQDYSNHRVTYQYPLMIGWVTGGNHSLMQGIISGRGVIVPDEVHDISLLIDAVEFDGLNWRSLLSGHRFETPPRYQELGWCWEIARRIKSLEPSPFRLSTLSDAR